MSNQGKELYEFGPYRLDPGKRLLLRDNQPIPLQLKAFETLLVLVRNSQQVVLKDDLMKSVWPDTFVEESNLTQHIFVLRKVLGQAAGEQNYIVTIPGRGYRFAAKVSIVSEAASQAVPGAVSHSVSQSASQEESLVVKIHSRSEAVIEESQPRRRPAIWLAGLGLAVALVVIAGYRSYRQRPRAESKAAATPAAVRPRRAVAVLSFKNLSGRSDPAWLSTAFAEMLTTELGTGDQLRMVSSEEVAHLQTSLSLTNVGTLSKDTLARVRHDLSADVVVLGSYSDLGKQAHGKIRLDLQVQDTSAGETVSTFSETGTEEELFQLVSRVGSRLREKLAVPVISADQAASVQAAMPANTQAERLYAEGLEKIRQFDALAARDFLKQAIAADPNFALAHSALAEAWSQLGYEGTAKAEAQKSFELSEKLPRKDRLFIEATYRKMNKEWDKAAALYRTLFEFFPDDIEYGLRLADAQTQGGKRSDAAATIAALRKLPPPLRDDVRIDLAEEMNFIRLGQYSAARGISATAVDKARAAGLDLSLARALYLQAATLAPLGESDKALAAAEESRKIYSAVGDQWGVSNALEYIAYVHSLHAEWDQAEKIYEQALALNRKIGSKTGAAIDLTSIAAGREARGDIEGGKRMDEEALAIYREIGDRSREGWALMGVAWATADEGALASSLSLDQQALAVFKDVADESGILYALDEQTAQLIQLGRLSEAETIGQQALGLARKSGVLREVVAVLFYQGTVAKLEGRLDDARKIFNEGLATDHSDAALAAEFEDGLAEVDNEDGRLADARQHAKQGLAYLHDHSDPSDEIGLQSMLASISLREKNTGEAVRAIDAAKALLGKSQGREEQFIFGIAHARVQAASGKLADARRTLNGVIAETNKDGNVRFQLEARLALYEVEAKSDPAAAQAHAKALADEAGPRGFGLIARKAKALATS